MLASFDEAIAVVLDNEKGWVDNPNDPGGETFRGISRKNFANWQGWTRVEELRQQKADLLKDEPLLSNVRSFYETQFWTPYHFELLESQAVATKIFDFAVNAGPVAAIRLLQAAISYFVPSARMADGKIGPLTVTLSAHVSDAKMIPELRARMAQHYALDAIKDPKEEEFLLGLMRRASA